MAKVVKIKELPELGLDAPNLLHIQESYLRQVAHSKPFQAVKKSKSDVTATGAKWYRQKGTGRARQGERTNPHLYGGGLAFPPHHRIAKKKLNKRVRISALRSAVLAHIQSESVFCIQGKGFEDFSKTREVAAVLDTIEGRGRICLVLPSGTLAWRACSNIAMLRVISPDQLNVRDLVDSECVVFTTNALDEYKTQLLARNEPAEAELVEIIAEPEATEAAPQAVEAEDNGDAAGGEE